MNKLLFTLLFLYILFPLRAQQNQESLIKKNFEQYQRRSLHEMLYVHTDRSFYLTGDYLWSKIYCVDGTFHQPLDLSAVVYLEILDSKNIPVLQTKIGMKEGKGHGSMFLPASINSGIYQLRAYTRWMKNFSPDFYFTKNITIVNPFKPLPSQEVEPEGKKYDIQFFPEGGNLVAGIDTRIAFRVVDQNGLGIPFRGIIFNQKGDTITTFSPLKFGLGHFRLKAEQGDSYHAVIKNVLDKKIAEKQLPAAIPEGYSLSLEENSDTVTLHVRYQSKEKKLKYGVLLLAHSNAVVTMSSHQTFVDNKTTFRINKNVLSGGITHFTLFDDQNNPVCERLYFKKPQEQLNITAHPDRKTYYTRQAVDLDIVSSNPSDTTLPANMSMSVYRLDSLEDEDQISMHDEFYLTSDLNGNIESPGYYFSDDPEVAEATDNLMLTHGWSRFVWKDILPADDSILEYFPEHQHPIISGSISHNGSGKKAEGIPVYLSIPGKDFKFRSVISNQSGDINFELQDFFGNQKIIVQTNPKVDSSYTIKIFDPYSQDFSHYQLPQLTLNKSLRNIITERSRGMQMENIYFEKERAKINIPSNDSVAFFGTPDYSYYLDDYVRFPAMVDVMKEYVHSIAVRRKKKAYHFMAYNISNKDLFEENPLILVDGVPVFDVNKIIAYDPTQVNRLDIVNYRYIFGPMTFQGIVSYATYNGDLNGFPINDQALIMDYEGLEWEHEYFSPVYETDEQKASRLPDRRNLIFWSPDIDTDESGTKKVRFYTSDLPGNYRIDIQGITNNGLIGSRQLIVKVKSSENN